ncbi:MAG TPA: DUF456 domain-containing protein [Tepidisphaeraceae bacterium]|nr:DUF456 domain-containing protein [Tepidisphaeraceae bacterium]
MLVWFYYFVLLLLMLASIALVLFSLPGVWLMVLLALIYAWLTHFQLIGAHTLIVILVLAAISEFLEFVAAGAGAKHAGGSSRASLGAIIGALVGGLVSTFFIPIPIIGTLAGLAGGAFVGSLILEQGRNPDPAHLLRVGFAAAKGRLLGVLVKIVFAIIIFLLMLVLAVP